MSLCHIELEFMAELEIYIIPIKRVLTPLNLIDDHNKTKISQRNKLKKSSAAYIKMWIMFKQTQNWSERK